VAVEKGDEAPDCELPGQGGEPVRLSDLRDGQVLEILGSM
jgi:peroxiredoxin